MVTLAPIRVDPPAVRPYLGGLLSVADIHDSSDPHVGMGVEYYTYLCSMGGVAPGMCEVPAGVTFDAAKRFESGDLVTAEPFAVYAGVQCDLFGAPYTDQASTKLANTEEYAVSRAFFQHLFQGGVTPAPPQLVDNLDDLPDAIGQLEQSAAEMYAGMPVLHMNRRTAANAVSCRAAFQNLDGTLLSGQGTPIANAPGYPDGVVFVTGSVHAWRTQVRTYDVPDTSENSHYSLAERIWSISTECFLAYAGELPPPPEES
jgi:hypothetical protein